MKKVVLFGAPPNTRKVKIMIELDSRNTLKVWYKLSLDTVKVHRFTGGHKLNPAFHAELLNSAH